MFDFGNKKLIEDLKREVKFQNNLVGVGLAIQDELKKKNEILEKEKIEYQKTIEYLTSEIDKLNDKIKKMNLERTGIEKDVNEEWIGNVDENNKEIKYYETYHTRYVEVYGIVEKINKKVENEEFTYFKVDQTLSKEFNYICSEFCDYKIKILTNEFIRYNIKRNIVFTYQNIPFRTLDDLYKIIDFFESVKYIKYFDIIKRNEYISWKNYSKIDFERIINQYFEIDTIDIKDKIKLKLLTNNNIKITIDNLSVYDFANKFYEENNKNKYYRQKRINSFCHNPFDNENELKKIIKNEIYNKKSCFYIANWFKIKINE